MAPHTDFSVVSSECFVHVEQFQASPDLSRDCQLRIGQKQTTDCNVLLPFFCCQQLQSADTLKLAKPFHPFLRYWEYPEEFRQKIDTCLVKPSLYRFENFALRFTWMTASFTKGEKAEDTLMYHDGDSSQFTRSRTRLNI